MNRRIRKTVRTVVWEDGEGNLASEPMRKMPQVGAC